MSCVSMLVGVGGWGGRGERERERERVIMVHEAIDAHGSTDNDWSIMKYWSSRTPSTN